MAHMQIDDTPTDEQWVAVGDAIRTRMVELAWSQTDLIRESGVSDMTIRPLLKGEPGKRHPQTLAKVAVALGWPGDALETILAGGQPPDISEVRTIPRWEAELVDTVRTLTEVVRELAAETRMARMDQAVRHQAEPPETE